MTIQISVLLWTILCFLLFMLILRNLLFRPLLGLMDARRERIDRAAQKKEEARAAAQRERALREEEEARQREMQEKLQRQQLERLRTLGKEQLDEANEERIRRADRYSAKAEEECAELLEILGERADAIAVAFAKRLIEE